MKYAGFIACLMGVLTLPVAAFAAAETKPSAPTDASDPRYNPDLGELYPSAEAWTATHTRMLAAAGKLPEYKGTLGSSPNSMLAALSAISAVRKETARLTVYALLVRDADVRVPASQERMQLATSLGTTLSSNTAWLAPEVLALGPDKVHSFLQQSPELSHRFGFFLNNVLRAGPHTLSAESEGVMAAANDVLQQPDSIFAQLADGELPFSTVTLSNGESVRLDEPAYEKYRQSPNRADRKLVFDTFWGNWSKFESTFGQTLTTQVMGEKFDAGVRHYPSALADALFGDNMPEAVYRQVVAQSEAGLPTVYRYLRLRKKQLGITDDLRYYDVYPSMFPLQQPLHIDVPEAQRITAEVTSVYGPEYAAALRRGFAGRWMDLLPRQGKSPGAYMAGDAYDVHPYLHFNHNFDYQSLSTFAHEWGHAVHSLLANQAQPYETASYSTFIAETASMSNEMLLEDYMIAHAKSKSEKLFYLGEGLESVRGGFFRQAMFATFQLAIHEELEQGRPLSGKRMTEIYCGLLKKYYGDAEGVTKIDPAYCIEWAFIPHFYYGFYVWQYATSIAGAAQFTSAIEKGTPGTRDRFIAMLKAGGSDYPYELYKKAGIDMATPVAYQSLVARMNHLLDQIEALQAQN
jgi:oligoendopeptidase F